MKTSGELLKETRISKDKSVEEIAAKIKIKPEYITFLEKNDFDSLPSGTFAKGILRKYAATLNINPDTVIAMFRRDFTEDESGHILPKGLIEPVSKSSRVIPINLILVVVGITSFLSFLGFQLYNYLNLPRLEIHQPISGEIYASKITVKGTTDPDNTITINNQKVTVGDTGDFSLDLTFPSGTHSIIIQATNRQGKTRLTQRTFQITD